jgi:2,5-furandicarboxylate decarboxylase 1
MGGKRPFLIDFSKHYVMDMKDFIAALEKSGDLVKIARPVSLKYEAAAIIKKLGARPVLFEKIKESQYPVVANICASRDITARALDCEKSEIIGKMVNAIDHPKKYHVSEADYENIGADLSKLPILIHYGEDGGPYISSAIVIASDKELGINSSFHRMMVIGKDRLAIRILPRHLQEFLNRGNREVAICIGTSVQMLIASAVSCELGKSELEIGNALRETKFANLDGHVVPESEFIMIAEITEELHDEGKFIDLTGTYDIVRKQPVVKVKKIYAKKDAIYHALLPGGDEHKTLMGMPREPTIFREVNKVCECIDAYLPTGGCSWLHGVVKIRKKHADDGKKAIEAAFSGHKSMKHVIIVDDDIDIYDPSSVEWAIATRVQGDKAIVIKPGEKGSSLDPSADPTTYVTCKVGVDATIPWGRDRNDFLTNKIPGEDKIDMSKLVKE